MREKQRSVASQVLLTLVEPEPLGHRKYPAEPRPARNPDLFLSVLENEHLPKVPILMN